ncbi:MAG: PEP-CTERM sorting domain-containing protein [Phycisphaerae bacterium]|nr:PEP-CTERM sorting domain-containing protein [Phycisphaerae bacterium]
MKKRVLQIAAVFAVIALVAANVQASVVGISIGIRETGTTEPIGGNGGSAGGIEWIDIDNQTLTLNGTWQRFTFDFGTASVTPFAGATANGAIDGTRGVLESIRIRNLDGTTGPISLWIDDVVNTVAAGSVVLTGFEGYTDDQQVMFRQPSFSGSTSGNLITPPNFAGVDNSGGYTGDASYRLEFEFKDDDAVRWLRLTTFGTGALPNPAIDFAPGSSFSFMMKATPEPTTLMLLGLGGLLLRRRR